MERGVNHRQKSANHVNNASRSRSPTNVKTELERTQEVGEVHVEARLEKVRQISRNGWGGFKKYVDFRLLSPAETRD